MNHIGLFEGIGGFSLAARWIGWQTIAWCEWNDFGQKVLKHHFPKAKAHGDITKTDFTIYRGQCDVLTGGFPCQPYSSAGKRLGKEDERHLWPEMLRAIREIQPRWVVGENVRGLTNWNGGLVFDEVQADLEAAGYEVTPFLLPACAVNAPHRRDRIWFVAYAKLCANRLQSKGGMDMERSLLEGRERCKDADRFSINGLDGDAADTECSRLEHGYKTRNLSSEEGKTRRERCKSTNEFEANGNENVANTDGIGLREQSNRIGEPGFISKDSKRNNWQNFPTVYPICNGDDGLSDRLDSITFPKWRNESIKAGGNAIVPHVAYQIFKAIKQYNAKL